MGTLPHSPSPQQVASLRQRDVPRAAISARVRATDQQGNGYAHRQASCERNGAGPGNVPGCLPLDA